MDIKDIQELFSFAEGFKKSLEARGCSKVSVEVIPDDNHIDVYFQPIITVKYITCKVNLKGL